MLEIYNESVFDLLAGKSRKALKIRQSKQRGFFGMFAALFKVFNKWTTQVSKFNSF